MVPVPVRWSGLRSCSVSACGLFPTDPPIFRAAVVRVAAATSSCGATLDEAFLSAFPIHLAPSLDTAPEATYAACVATRRSSHSSFAYSFPSCRYFFCR